MPRKSRPRFVALAAALNNRYPTLDVEAAVRQKQVVVDGTIITNAAARVRSDADIRVVAPTRLRGEIKLAHALEAFDMNVAGRICVDVGASAGGFTQALLAAGAARVYAVDAGIGQLRWRLRTDERVVNLEGHNLGELSPAVIPDFVDVVTVDLSYLSVADAVPQLEALRLAPSAELVALVKPTFELRAGALASAPEHVEAALARACAALEAGAWSAVATTEAPRTGRRGAIEAFLYARRQA